MYQPAQAITVDHAQAILDDGLRAIASGQTQFDLSNVTAVDSSAVAVLLNWQRAARQASTDVSFVSVPASLASLIGMYGVTQLLNVQVASAG